YGKDHSTNTPIYDAICEILGETAPEHFTYELFLDENGEKISKSKGNGLSIDEWLTYASTESLSYFMFQKPKTAKRLYFDVIPKAVDEYHQQLRAYAAANDPAARLANPVWHIHGGNVPVSTLVVPFAMLLNLASVSGAEDKETLWGFIRRYAPEASPETHPDLDQAAGFAVRYFNDFVRPTRVYRAPTETEREALADLDRRLAALPVDADGETIQTEVYTVGKSHDFANLRDWFTGLYQVLLGQDQGPRFGSFVALYGIAETRALIEKALGGALSGSISSGS
ncbi:MAG: lysine--tRNA ligase, partial [Hyphomicrobiales bacterium]|nr:lysine--tRNA ligase [Hyphomicrobiales bacterium]